MVQTDFSKLKLDKLKREVSTVGKEGEEGREVNQKSR